MRWHTLPGAMVNPSHPQLHPFQRRLLIEFLERGAEGNEESRQCSNPKMQRFFVRRVTDSE